MMPEEQTSKRALRPGTSVLTMYVHVLIRPGHNFSSGTSIRPDRTTLSSSLSQFNIAQEEVGNACKDDTELEADIHSKGRIEQTGDRTNIVNLCCSKQHTH